MLKTIPSDLVKLDDASYLESAQRVRDVKGWSVIGQNDEKIGDIEYLLGSTTQQRAYLAIVDCGGLFTNKHVAIPVEQMRFDPEEKKAYVPYVKDQIKDAPGYSSNVTEFNHFYDYWTNRTKIPSDLVKLEDASYLTFPTRVDDVKGWKVIGQDNEKIGDIEYLLGSRTRQRAYLAIVDCGGLFKDKHVAIPIDQIRFDADGKKAFVPYVKDQIKNAPDYSSNVTDYNQYCEHWTNEREEMFSANRK